MVGNTPLVQVPNLSPREDVRLWVKLEGQNPTGSVKDRIAVAMVEAGEASGALTKDKTILEPTSGNTGIALAMVARIRGYRFTAVIPENASRERTQLMAAFGAELVFSDGDKGTNGAVALAQEMATDERYFMPFQYGNDANVQAHYNGTGAEIIDDLPEVKAFVAGLGTGGTLTGVGEVLKEKVAGVRIVAVEPARSPVLSGGRARPHAIQGIGASFVPGVLNRSIIDEIMTVRDEDAIAWSRRLAREEGLLVGISAGAAAFAACAVAATLTPAQLVLTILPDTGERYLSLG